MSKKYHMTTFWRIFHKNISKYPSLNHDLRIWNNDFHWRRSDVWRIYYMFKQKGDERGKLFICSQHVTLNKHGAASLTGKYLWSLWRNPRGEW